MDPSTGGCIQPNRYTSCIRSVTTQNRPIVFAALASMAEEAPIEFVVRGTSMAPLLREGDRVQVAQASAYRAGDLLVFRNSVGDLVAHRLLGQRRWRGEVRYVLRGDAAPATDGIVAPEAVLGRVVGGAIPRRLIEVPWRDRWRARWRFLAYGLSRLLA